MSKKARVVYFVTGNTGKVNEVMKMVDPNIKIEQIDYDYPEIQVDELEEVASMGLGTPRRSSKNRSLLKTPGSS